MIELSYVGSPKELMDYIKSFIPNCNMCNDTGFIEKTEWSGEDDSYDITIKCDCNQD